MYLTYFIPNLGYWKQESTHPTPKHTSPDNTRHTRLCIGIFLTNTYVYYRNLKRLHLPNVPSMTKRIADCTPGHSPGHPVNLPRE